MRQKEITLSQIFELSPEMRQGLIVVNAELNLMQTAPRVCFKKIQRFTYKDLCAAVFREPEDTGADSGKGYAAELLL